MDVYEIGPIVVRVVHRSEWDRAGRGAGYQAPLSQFRALVPHHTATSFLRAYYELVCDRMRWLQTLRPDLGPDVPYTGCVFAGPTPNEAWLAEGRGPGWTGAHTYGHNRTTYGVAFWGNSDIDPVDPAVLEAFRLAGRLWISPYTSPLPTWDHGSYPDQYTACAGSRLRGHLAALQPPYLPAAAIPAPTPAKEPFMSDFTLDTSPFLWEDQPGQPPEVEGMVVAARHGAVRPGDIVTAWFTTNPAQHGLPPEWNCYVQEASGAPSKGGTSLNPTVQALAWGRALSWRVDSGGLTAFIIGADAARAGIRVTLRSP